MPKSTCYLKALYKILWLYYNQVIKARKGDADLKLKSECDASIVEDEILIRYKSHTDRIRYIEEFLERIINEKKELTLHIRDTEYYIPACEILYFETEVGKVKAHTKERIFTSNLKLFEITETIGSHFVRISKCCVVNVDMIEAVRHSVTGSGEVFFKGCDKKAYVSRIYFTTLKEKLKESRLLR